MGYKSEHASKSAFSARLPHVTESITVESNSKSSNTATFKDSFFKMNNETSVVPSASDYS